MHFRTLASIVLAGAVLASCAPETPEAALSGPWAGLRLGAPIRHENLTAIPVLSDRPESREELVPLREALEKKWLSITEKADGEVSRLMLNNASDKRIFILSGEVITGGNQDRIIAGDRIIEARQRDIDLDVFCVEAGRWTEETKGFYSKENMGTTDLREKAQRKGDSAQSEIWSEIAKVNAENKVSSGSDAYQAVYDQKEIREKLARFGETMQSALDPRAVGVVIGIGGRVQSVDVFDNTTLFRHYWPLILKSSSLAALNSKEQGELTPTAAMKMLAAARRQSTAGGGQAEKNRAAVTVKDELNTSVLKSADREVHFSAFPVEKEKTDERRDLLRGDSEQQYDMGK